LVTLVVFPLQRLYISVESERLRDAALRDWNDRYFCGSWSSSKFVFQGLSFLSRSIEDPNSALFTPVHGSNNRLSTPVCLATMDPFATPVRRSRSAGHSSPRMLKKQQLLSLIQSIDFDHLLISDEYSASNNEGDIAIFFTEVCSALSKVLIKQSPPKSTPRKLLERNIDLSSLETPEMESPLKSKSTYSAKPTTGKSTKLYLSGDDSQDVVKYTPLPTSDAPDSASSTAFIYPPLDEDTIVKQFCEVQPWYTAEGVKKELPQDPSERYQRLRMYADVVPYFSQCMFLSRSLSSN
jgi:hypothetical protein